MRVARPVRRAGRRDGPRDNLETALRPDPYTHFGQAGRAATAIEDIVSRKWLTTVLSVEETSTQVEVAFARALEQEGLMDAIGDRLDGRIPPDRPDGTHTPVLLAWSDNGPQMTSDETSTFMALHLIGQHFGRPHTP